MGWQDEIRQASFRGVEFFFTETSSDFGRRTANHQYPNRDTGFVEDLGRKQATYKIKAYYIGDDWAVRRDRLREACETAGSGKLIHPYYGELTVVCTSITITENGSEGKKVGFSLEFVEAGSRKEPLNTSSTDDAVSLIADIAEKVLIAGFANEFSVASQPGYVADAAQVNIDSLVDILVPLAGNITNSTDGATATNSLTVLKGNSSALLDPASLGTTVAGFMKDVGTSPTGFSAMTAASSYTVEQPSNTTTPAQLKQQANATATSRFAGGLTLVNKARAIATQDYTDVGTTDLKSLLTNIVDEFDTFIEDETDDDKLTAMVNMRSAAVADINKRLLVAPQVVTYEFPEPLPSLVVAHKIYGDATEAGSLVTRNNVGNPFFMKTNVEALIR